MAHVSPYRLIAPVAARTAEVSPSAVEHAGAPSLAPSLARQNDRRPRGSTCDDDDLAETSPATTVEHEHERVALQGRLAAYLQRGRARVVFTDNLHTMVTIKRGQGVWTFRVHHMFGLAPPVVVRALARYAETNDRESAGLLRAYIDGNEHRVRARESVRAIPIDVCGKYHDLQAIFDDINTRYFAGCIRARITWGPRGRRMPGRSSIKLGSYTYEDRLIRIHPVLDAIDVPDFFVAWIVYHEMLHEVHDMPVVDGRRIYHTAEFRRAEAAFERYAEAALWERMNLHRLLDR